jgi:hypothetical protein
MILVERPYLKVADTCIFYSCSLFRLEREYIIGSAHGFVIHFVFMSVVIFWIRLLLPIGVLAGRGNGSFGEEMGCIVVNVDVGYVCVFICMHWLSMDNSDLVLARVI